MNRTALRAIATAASLVPIVLLFPSAPSLCAPPENIRIGVLVNEAGEDLFREQKELSIATLALPTISTIF